MKTAVILAAGIGNRLKNKLKEKPKGFIELGGQPIIKRSINCLKSVRISKIIIGTGYLSEYYEAFQDGASIYCCKNNLFATTGSFYTLYNMRQHINEDFLLLESDIVYQKSALTLLQNNPKSDLILASGETGSGDEVFIEVDINSCLVNLSKNHTELSDIYGELVGISKLSLDTYKMLCQWGDHNKELSLHIDYEKALTRITDKRNIYVEKIVDLIWAEIDTVDHYRKAVDYIYPRLLKKENEV